MAQGKSTEDDEQNIAVGLFERTITRADALRVLYSQEVEEARRERRPSESQKALDWLKRLLDPVSHLDLILNGNRDHTKPTNFAYDFSEWTKEEIRAFYAKDDIGGGGIDDLTRRRPDLVPKINALNARAGRIWRDDEETMLLIVAARGN